MAAVRILVDTDIFIDYFNAGHHAGILDDRQATIYYSVVTRKELLGRFRLVPLTPAIAARYAAVRRSTPDLEREDGLIAATTLDKRLPLMTRNWRHFRRVPGLTLYGGR